MDGGCDFVVDIMYVYLNADAEDMQEERTEW